MKHLNLLRFILIAFTASSLFLTSCSEDEDSVGQPDIEIPTPELAFVGSEACQSCHAQKYELFIKSGHPYKLNKVNGSQPVIPFTTADGLNIPTPAGYGWGDITYMIGGYGWKARFLDSDGFIITEHDDTQYNIADGSQVAYHGSDPIGTKKYDCGKCHTTGWKHIDDGGAPKDGLAGMAGHFYAGGIHCEECHGMGSTHIATQKKSDISIDRSSELCGRCHTRNADRSIAASGGFVKHHEQYDEWLVSGGHYESGIGCNTCHDVHASTKYDAIAPGEGVKKSCTDCHSSYNASKHTGMDISCITCHMPKSSKSAIKTGAYVGDIRSHQFKINPNKNYEMFNEAGNLASGNGVSLEYACYQCHKDKNGNGGEYSQQSKIWLASMAFGFHDN